MNNPNTNKFTQSEFDTLPLFLSEKADHEIDFINDMVVGVVYIAIGSEDNLIGLDFKAHINKVYTAGELWKDVWGVHCVDVPVIEVDNVTNITVSYNDSNVNNIINTCCIINISNTTIVV